jgi:hypothetical protein
MCYPSIVHSIRNVLCFDFGPGILLVRQKDIRLRWRRVDEPGARDLKGISSPNDDSVFNGSKYEVTAWTKPDKRGGLSVDLGEIHVRWQERRE